MGARSPYIRYENNQVIHYSPFSDTSRLVPSSAVELMFNAPSMKFPRNREILVDALHPSEVVTTGSFRHGAVALASLLHKKYGIKKGDVVNLFVLNSVLLPQVHLGIFSTGAVISPANIMYLPEELNYQLNKTKSKIVITIPESVNVVEEAIKLGNNGEKSTVEHVLFLDDVVREALETFPYTEEQIYGMSLKEIYGVLPPDAATLGPNDRIYYCFSSGTSGVPKGVITIHNNMVSNTHQQVMVMSNVYRADRVFGAFLPMSHIYGLSKFVFCLPYVGSKIVLMQRFDLEVLLKSVQDHKINFLHIVPPVAVLFAKSPLVDKYPKAKESLVGMMSGAAPLSKELSQEVTDRLGVHVSQGYGLTETSPVTHTFGFDPKAYRIASIGWLFPGMEARIVSEDGKEIADPDERGELWLKGPNVFKGYLDNAESTKDAFATLEQGSGKGDALEWFKTGDVATIDETGQYYIVDRFKELIKSKGHQVAPAELEAILLTHPYVADAAVTGLHVPEEGTEYPRAFVVYKDGIVGAGGKSEEKVTLEVLEWFNQKVAKHKRLWGGLVVLHEIPKSPSGKILRRLLRNRKDNEEARVYGFKTKAKL